MKCKPGLTFVMDTTISYQQDMHSYAACVVLSLGDLHQH
jgi:hypothetical protein